MDRELRKGKSPQKQRRIKKEKIEEKGRKSKVTKKVKRKSNSDTQYLNDLLPSATAYWNNTGTSRLLLEP